MARINSGGHHIAATQRQVLGPTSADGRDGANGPTGAYRRPRADASRRPPRPAASRGGVSKFRAWLKGLTRIARPTKPTPVVRQSGDRKVGLTKLPNGKFEVSMSRPPVRQLVFSGGGKKGSAYTGAVRKMEQEGVLTGVKVMRGSSIGAITSTLLASGVRSDTFRDRMESTTKQPLIGQLEGRLRNHVRDSVLTTIDAKIRAGAGDLSDDQMATLTGIRARLLGDDSAGVTFGDLRALSGIFPETFKELSVTGTVKKDGQATLQIFDADQTPDVDVAKAAHASAALPGVFLPVRVETPDGARWFKDGGVKLNIPASEIVAPSVASDSIAEPDSLIFAFEGFRKVKYRNFQYNNNRLEPLKDQMVEVKLKVPYVNRLGKERIGNMSGFFGGTLGLGMTRGRKEGLEMAAEASVASHLEQRREKPVTQQFDSLEQAALALGDAEFEQLRSGATGDTRVTLDALAAFRTATSGLADRVAEAHRAEVAAGRGDGVTEPMREALLELDTLIAGDTAKARHVAKLLNRPGSAAVVEASRGSALEDALPESLKAAIDEREVRDIRRQAHTQIRDLVFDRSFSGQTARNRRVLGRVRDLLDDVRNQNNPADAKAKYNEALQHFVDNYRGRSSTIDKARAAMLP